FIPGKLTMDLSLWQQMIPPDNQPWVLEQPKAHLPDSSVSYAFSLIPSKTTCNRSSVAAIIP
ncbi:MAG TPA: hypothetical protein V6C57_18105, partial [Coleofasciculaceae cyanobacterium]